MSKFHIDYPYTEKYELQGPIHRIDPHFGTLDFRHLSIKACDNLFAQGFKDLSLKEKPAEPKKAKD